MSPSLGGGTEGGRWLTLRRASKVAATGRSVGHRKASGVIHKERLNAPFTWRVSTVHVFVSRILKRRLSLSPRFFPACLGYCREPGLRCRTHLSLAPSRWSDCIASRLYLCPPRPLGSANLGSRSPAHSSLLSRDRAISSLRRCPEKPGQFIAKGIDLFLEVGRSPQFARR